MSKPTNKKTRKPKPRTEPKPRNDTRQMGASGLFLF